MAVPLYTASPINTNAPQSAFPMSPSTFAMRYTPASALEEQLCSSAAMLASAIPLPPSQPCTPSPEARQNANAQSHASNAFPPSPTPLKAQPYQVNTTTSTSASSSPCSTPIRTPSLSRLSIPSTPPPKTIPQPYTTSSLHSPVSQPSSTYSPPHLPHHHTRNMSSISALSSFDLNATSSPFSQHQTPNSLNIPATPGNNPPGYVQNTRDSFEDRPVADVEEQTYSLPRSPLRHGYSASMGGIYAGSPFYATPNPLQNHGYRKSMSAGPGILNGEIFFQPLDGSMAEGVYEGDDKGVWEMAGKWARTAYKKLGEAEEGVWRVVSGDR